MKTRWIKGVSAAHSREIVTTKDDAGLALKTPVSMRVEVDKDLPPNTIKLSTNWGQRNNEERIVDEALNMFLTTICRSLRIEEITSDTLFKPVEPEETGYSYIPLTSPDPLWHDTRTDAQRTLNVMEAQTFASFVNTMAQMRYRIAENGTSLSMLRFDTVVRLVWPVDYLEFRNISVNSVLSRVAKVLGDKLNRIDHMQGHDVLADRIVNRVIDLINRGQWGKF